MNESKTSDENVVLFLSEWDYNKELRADVRVGYRYGSNNDSVLVTIVKNNQPFLRSIPSDEPSVILFVDDLNLVNVVTIGDVKFCYLDEKDLFCPDERSNVERDIIFLEQLPEGDSESIYYHIRVDYMNRCAKRHLSLS